MTAEERRYRVRAARADELPLLPAIEDAAGRRYGEVGIDDDLPGLSLDAFADGHRAGLLLVVADAYGPVGFALSWQQPGALHLRELDVHPAHNGLGLGARLIDGVCREALRRARTDVTLTTFAEVPWNRPYYERRGFLVLSEASCPPWLSRIRAQERASGLDRWPRVAMARCATPA